MSLPPEAETVPFEYSNLTGRGTGPIVSVAARLLPGVRAVQDQVRPYAQSWQEANRQALAGSGPLWIALGDSMTQGIGASAFDRGWVGQLQRRFADEGDPIRVVNLSMSGARVRDVLDLQLPELRRLVATGERPVLVTVLIGSNDIFRRSYRNALPEAFEELLAALPAGAVVANLPNPNSGAQLINDAIHRAVAERQLVLAEMRRPDTTSWRGRLAPDHFHPNDQGYALIAGVFGDAVERRWPAQRNASKMSSEVPGPDRPTAQNHSVPKASR